MNYQYIKDFHKSRESKIGASDIPKLIPSPNRPIESLAAWTDQSGQRHHETALDLYYEKVDGKDWEYSFPADMGHWLEPKALYEFISDNISRDIAIEFLRGYQLHKIEQEMQSQKAGRLICVNAEPYNTTPFKHNTESKNYYGVAHADCVYNPDEMFSKMMFIKKMKKSFKSLPMKKNEKGEWILNLHGIEINLSKPFILEAKSARSHTVSARKHDKYKGYDLKLKEWQGVPLKVYFQVQYQMYLYGIDICYISLLFDTSEKHYWTIKANKKHQNDLVQYAAFMKKCIDEKTPPKELVMNSKDISKLYPEIKDDFRELKDEELQTLLKIAVDRKYYAKQEGLHKRNKEDCDQRMSIHLKDTEKLKGQVNGSLVDIAKWNFSAGGQYVMGLNEIDKRDDSKVLRNYLEEKGLIKEKAKNKSAKIVISKKELDQVVFEDDKQTEEKD